jgi:hypothetical protein
VSTIRFLRPRATLTQVSYRDDVTGLRARTAELERELAGYRAAGPSGAEVQVEELTAQRAHLARLTRPYLWLLLQPLAWLLVRAGVFASGSPADRLAVCLAPALLAVAHLAFAVRQQARAVRERRELARRAEREHAATRSLEARHAARAAAIDAEIREIGHALSRRRAALVRQNEGPGAVPVVLLVVSAVAAAMGTGHASTFEPLWSGVAVLGFVGFLLGVASLAARVALNETVADERARGAEPASLSPPIAQSTPWPSSSLTPGSPMPARIRNDYALELARHEALEAELASYRHAGKSGPAMRLVELSREAHGVASHWQPFTWLAFELAMLALARSHSLPLSLTAALVVPPGAVLAAFALHAFGRAIALQRRLGFALAERATFAAIGAGAAPRLAASLAALYETKPAVHAAELDEEACVRSLRAGRRERRTSLLLFAGAAFAFVASVGSLTPRAGAHGAMLLGMIIGVSALTALASLGFLAFAMVQVVHRRRLLAIARLATRLERKKRQRLEHAHGRVGAEPRFRVAVSDVPSAPASVPADASSGQLAELEPDPGSDRDSAVIARRFA